MRRFIARITETLIIIKNKYGSPREPLTLQFLYRRQNKSKLEIIGCNHEQPMASLTQGVYQEMCAFKNKKNSQLIEIVFASLHNSLKIINKYYQLVETQMRLKLHQSENKGKSLLNSREKPEQQKETAKKKQDKLNNVVYKKIGMHIDKSMGLYSGMNVDEQWLRSLILQSKNHYQDIKNDQIFLQKI